MKKTVKKLYKSETIRYLIWGGISMAVNVLLFAGLSHIMNYVVANVITLVFLRIFCFFTNKSFVFITPYGTWKETLKEFVIFVLARFVTFFIDLFGVMFFIEHLGFANFLAKLSVVVITTVLNYVFAKFLVFSPGKVTDD
jgi:putative flippase GtrA